MGWLIAAGIFVLLALIPLGVVLQYRQTGFRIWILTGPVRFCVCPLKKQKPKTDQPSTSRKQSGHVPQKTEQSPEKGGKWTDFLPLVRVGLELLGELRRKIVIKKLFLHLILAGDDPCDLAVLTGKMNAAMAGLLASLDRCFRIRKQDVTLACDFMADETTVLADVTVTITLGRLVGLAIRYGWRSLKAFLKIKKQRESGVMR